MMELYQDSNGEQVYCIQLTGPTILNTVEGEKCAEETDWMVLLPNGKCAVVKNETFVQGFTKVE